MANSKHNRSAPNNRKELITLLFIIFAIDFVLCGFAFVSDNPRAYFMEDGLIETLTAVLFATSAALAAFTLFFVPPSRDCYRKWLVFVFIVGLVLALEEISFGERLFGLSMPTVLGIKFDGLHDLIEMAITAMGIQLNIYVFAAVFIAALISSVFLAMRLNLGKRIMNAEKTNPGFSIYASTAALVFFLVVAQLIDSHIFGRINRSFAFEELLEMNSAIVLVGIGVVIISRRRNQTAPTHR